MDKPEESPEKAYSLRISKNALLDINEITGYIALYKRQPLNAIRVGDKIYETIDQIRNHPWAFKECEEIPTKEKNYRKAVCMSWLIIYKIKETEITILGILHGSRRTSAIKKLK